MNWLYATYGSSANATSSAFFALLALLLMEIFYFSETRSTISEVVELDECPSMLVYYHSREWLLCLAGSLLGFRLLESCEKSVASRDIQCCWKVIFHLFLFSPFIIPRFFSWLSKIGLDEGLYIIKTWREAAVMTVRGSSMPMATSCGVRGGNQWWSILNIPVIQEHWSHPPLTTIELRDTCKRLKDWKNIYIFFRCSCQTNKNVNKIPFDVIS